MASMCSRNVALGSWEVMAILKETYIESAYYARFIKALTGLELCPFAGVVTEEQFKLAIGEWLNIWPASIAPN